MASGETAQPFSVQWGIHVQSLRMQKDDGFNENNWSQQHNDCKKLFCRRARSSEDRMLQSIAKQIPCKWIRILVNGCCDISLNITEKPFANVPFEVHFVMSPAPSCDDRTVDFVVVVIQSRHLREASWFVDCCTLKLMHASVRGWRWLHVCVKRRGHFKHFSFAAFLNWSLWTHDFQIAMCCSRGVNCLLSQTFHHLEVLRLNLF